MLHLPVAGSTIRVLLRVYFTVVVVLIALLGDVCCNLWVRRRLLQNRPVKLTHMTGWQRGVMPYWMMFKLRAMPGGIVMGSLMMVTSILAVFSDLAVSALVRDESAPGHCGFEGGMVVASDQGLFSSSSSSSMISIFPDINGEAVLWAWSAQSWSVFNGGSLGIYRRVDNNTRFRAHDTEDVLGAWTCAYASGDAAVPSVSFPWTASFVDVVNSSVADGRLYPYTNTDQIRIFTDVLTDKPNPADYAQLFALTASNAGYRSAAGGSAWDVRALVDWNRTDTAERNFHALHCTVAGRDKDFIDSVLGHVDAAETLARWAPAVQGAMYRGVGGEVYNDTATRLAKYLNCLVMVAAAAQSVSSPANPLERIGCVEDVATVPHLVAALVLITGALLVWLCAYNVILLVSCLLYRSRYRKDARRKVWDQTPGSLMEWMACALRESKIPAANNALPAHLKAWNFAAELGAVAAYTRFEQRRQAADSVYVQYESVGPQKTGA